MMLSALLLSFAAAACHQEAPVATPYATHAPMPSAIAAWLDTGGLPVSQGFARPAGQRRGCTWELPPGPVNAPSHGQVALTPDGLNLIAIAYRNHHRHRIELRYRGKLSATGRNDEHVKAGQLVGRAVTAVTLQAHIDGRPLAAEALFRDFGELFDPHREERLVVVHQGSREMVVRIGAREHRVRAGFGQVPGKKVQRGDNKSPRGMYFVTNRHRGAFGGPYGGYYGGHWIKVNYPNAFDAARGLRAGWIDARRADSIAEAWKARKLTDQKSRLGGGIGFHGWIDSWSDDDPWLSWGCLVMHNADIAALYSELPPGTMVILM